VVTSPPERQSKTPSPPRWLRVFISILGLLLYGAAGYLAVGVFLLLAGPWQVKEMGDGPDRPLWLIGTAYGFAFAGLAFCGLACFRWIKGK
jgi:hypothetical protein